jgi:calmodulin
MGKFSEDELEEIQEAFECFCGKTKDDKPDGFIDTKGFDSVLRMLGGNPTEAQLAEMHKKLGKEKKITFDDFLPFWEAQSKDKGPELDDLVEAFSVFDKEGNGFIEVNELRSIYMSFGEKLTQEEVDEAMEGLDDGSGMVNIAEAAQMMLA